MTGPDEDYRQQEMDKEYGSGGGSEPREPTERDEVRVEISRDEMVQEHQKPGSQD